LSINSIWATPLSFSEPKHNANVEVTYSLTQEQLSHSLGFDLFGGGHDPHATAAASWYARSSSRINASDKAFVPTTTCGPGADLDAATLLVVLIHQRRAPGSLRH
jgi:hypothetical protein